MVTPADVQDYDGGWMVLESLVGRCVRLVKIWADGRYAGTLVEIAQAWYHRVLEIVTRSPEAKGFEVQPHRWIVERTLAWFGNCRRLARSTRNSPKAARGLSGCA